MRTSTKRISVRSTAIFCAFRGTNNWRRNWPPRPFSGRCGRRRGSGASARCGSGCAKSPKTPTTPIKRRAAGPALRTRLCWGQLADPAPPPEEAAAARDQAARLRAIADGLPEPYREVFRLRAFRELPYKDIASLYEKTANWACVTYHRAREMIRRRWEEEER